MIQVDVSVNAAVPLLALRNGATRMAFAIVRAINQTAETTQIAVRGQVFREFTVRKPAFIVSQVKMFRASVASRFEARVGIGIGKGLSGSPLLLPGFEEGAVRRPVKGRRVAVPAEARPSKTQSIPEQLYIQRLQLRPITRGRGRRRRAVSGGDVVRKGLQRTYQIPKLGIFQRIAARTTRLLYPFVAPFRLDRRLRFYITARGVIDRDFGGNLRREVLATFRRTVGR